MTDSTTVPSVREQQRATAGVLAELLAKDAPEVSWQVAAHNPRVLLGHASGLTGDQLRGVISVWAAHLGGDVKQESYPRGKDYRAHTRVWTHGRVGEDEQAITVEVWGHIYGKASA